MAETPEKLANDDHNGESFDDSYPLHDDSQVTIPGLDMPSSRPTSSNILQGNPSVLRDAEKINQLQLRYFDLQVELKSVRDELRDLGKLPRRSNEDTEANGDGDILVNHQVLIASLESKNTNLQNENCELNVTVKRLGEEKDKLSKELKHEHEKIHILERKLDNVSTTPAGWINDLESELQASNSQIKSLQVHIEALNREKESLLRELEARRSAPLSGDEIANLRIQVNSQRQSRLKISAMLEEQLAVNDKNMRLFEMSKRRISSLNAEIRELKGNLDYDSSNMGKLRRKLRKARIIRREYSQKVAESNQKISELEQEKQTVSQKCEFLEEKLNDEKNYCSELENRVSLQQDEIDQLSSALQQQKASVVQFTEEIKSQESRNAELQAKFEEELHQNRLTSELLERGSKDYNDAKTEIDRLRTSLQKSESEVDQLKFEISNHIDSKENLVENLNEARKKYLQLEQIKGTAQVELEACQSRLASEREKYDQQIVQLNEKRNSDILQVQEQAKFELDKLRSEKSQRENQLKATIVSLENQVLDLRDEKLSVEVDRDGLIVRDRNNQRKINNLESALAETTSKLNDAQTSVRNLQSDLSELRTKLENTKRNEASLIQSTRQLEQTVSSQAVQLQEVSNKDFSSLERQAKEGIVAINELSRLREEYSHKMVEWSSLNESYNAQIQKLSDTIKALENESSSLRAPPYVGIQGQLNRCNHSESQEQEFRTLFYETNFKLQQLNSQLSDKSHECARWSAAFDNANSELQHLRSLYENFQNAGNDLSAEKSQWKKKLEELQEGFAIEKSQWNKKLQELKNGFDVENLQLNKTIQDLQSTFNNEKKQWEHTLQEIQSEFDAKNKIIDQLNEKLRSVDQYVSQESNIRLEIEKQLEYQKKIQKEECDHFVSVILARSYQIENLIFIKGYFTSRYPDDGDLDSLTIAEKRKPRTLKGIFLFFVGIVKFKRAYDEGIMKRLQNSAPFNHN